MRTSAGSNAASTSSSSSSGWFGGLLSSFQSVPSQNTGINNKGTAPTTIYNSGKYNEEVNSFSRYSSGATSYMNNNGLAQGNGAKGMNSNADQQQQQRIVNHYFSSNSSFVGDDKVISLLHPIQCENIDMRKQPILNKYDLHCRLLMSNYLYDGMVINDWIRSRIQYSRNIHANDNDVDERKNMNGINFLIIDILDGLSKMKYSEKIKDRVLSLQFNDVPTFDMLLELNFIIYSYLSSNESNTILFLGSSFIKNKLSFIAASFLLFCGLANSTEEAISVSWNRFSPQLQASEKGQMLKQILGEFENFIKKSKKQGFNILQIKHSPTLFLEQINLINSGIHGSMQVYMYHGSRFEDINSCRAEQLNGKEKDMVFNISSHIKGDVKLGFYNDKFEVFTTWFHTSLMPKTSTSIVIPINGIHGMFDRTILQNMKIELKYREVEDDVSKQLLSDVVNQIEESENDNTNAIDASEKVAEAEKKELDFFESAAKQGELLLEQYMPVSFIGMQTQEQSAYEKRLKQIQEFRREKLPVYVDMFKKKVATIAERVMNDRFEDPPSEKIDSKEVKDANNEKEQEQPNESGAGSDVTMKESEMRVLDSTIEKLIQLESKNINLSSILDGKTPKKSQIPSEGLQHQQFITPLSHRVATPDVSDLDSFLDVYLKDSDDISFDDASAREGMITPATAATQFTTLSSAYDNTDTTDDVDDDIQSLLQSISEIKGEAAPQLNHEPSAGLSSISLEKKEFVRLLQIERDSLKEKEQKSDSNQNEYPVSKDDVNSSSDSVETNFQAPKPAGLSNNIQSPGPAVTSVVVTTAANLTTQSNLAVIIQSTASAQAETAQNGSLSNSNNHELIKPYIKMLEMGVPRPAVEQKMRKDNVDPTLLPIVERKEVKDQQTLPPPQEPLMKKVGDDDCKYAVYFKMLKMGIPRAAVEIKMKTQSVNPKILDLSPNDSIKLAEDLDQEYTLALAASASSQESSSGNGKLIKKKSRRRVLHWLEPVQGGALGNPSKRNLWTDISMLSNEELTKDADAQKDLEELFLAKRQQNNSSVDADKMNENLKASDIKSEKLPPSILPSRRAQNVEIGLAKLKQSPKDFVDALMKWNTKILSSNIVEIIQCSQLLPTAEEVKLLKQQYENANDNTTKKAIADEYLLTVATNVPDADKRIQTLGFYYSFDSLLDQLKKSSEVLKLGCEEVRTSAKFKRLLHVILYVGNHLSKEMTDSNAQESDNDDDLQLQGFSLKSLSNICHSKSSDGKATMLEKLCAFVIRRFPDISDIYESELRHISEAKRFTIPSLFADLDSLEKGVMFSKTLMKSQRIDNSQGADEDMQSDDQGLEKVVSFIRRAEELVEERKTFLKETKEKFIELAQYFGEEGSQDPAEILNVIDSFMVAFQSHIKKLREQEKRSSSLAKSQSSQIQRSISTSSAASFSTNMST